jgi:molecular chaperone Hsp33
VNTLHRFLFKDLAIRGQHIRLTDAWQCMTQDRHYPPVLTQFLGELTAVSVMLASGMKHQGKLTLQIMGEGPVNLLVVEVTNDLKVKGVAKTNAELPALSEATLDALLGKGQILVTLENLDTDTLYQSYVPREGKTVAEAFEAFMTQSDQLETKLWLHADEHTTAGLLLQKMPETDEKDSDAWNRITHLASTVKPEELLNLEAIELLHRLFHEETVELFDPQEVRYECPHDKGKIDAMLLSLGREEVDKILEKEGEIVIHNEMCNQHERYGKEDIDQLFSEAEMAEKSAQDQGHQSDTAQ